MRDPEDDSTSNLKDIPVLGLDVPPEEPLVCLHTKDLISVNVGSNICTEEGLSSPRKLYPENVTSKQKRKKQREIIVVVPHRPSSSKKERTSGEQHDDRGNMKKSPAREEEGRGRQVLSPDGELQDLLFLRHGSSPGLTTFLSPSSTRSSGVAFYDAAAAPASSFGELESALFYLLPNTQTLFIEDEEARNHRIHEVLTSSSSSGHPVKWKRGRLGQVSADPMFHSCAEWYVTYHHGKSLQLLCEEGAPLMLLSEAGGGKTKSNATENLDHVERGGEAIVVGGTKIKEEGKKEHRHQSIDNPLGMDEGKLFESNSNTVMLPQLEQHKRASLLRAKLEKEQKKKGFTDEVEDEEEDEYEAISNDDDDNIKESPSTSLVDMNLLSISSDVKEEIKKLPLELLSGKQKGGNKSNKIVHPPPALLKQGKARAGMMSPTSSSGLQKGIERGNSSRGVEEEVEESSGKKKNTEDDIQKNNVHRHRRPLDVSSSVTQYIVNLIAEIKNASYLQSLTLHHMRLRIEHMYALVYLGIHQMTQTCLTRLALTFCNLDTTLIVPLCEWIAVKGKSCPLISLDLSHNRLHGESLSLLQEAIYASNTLIHLSVRGNPITEEGSGNLLALLVRCASLRYVDIGFCGFRDVTLVKLGTLLHIKKNLTHMVLDGANLSRQGAIMFLDSIVGNTSLVFLSLKYIYYCSTRTYIRRLQQVLQRNALRRAKKEEAEEQMKLRLLLAATSLSSPSTAQHRSFDPHQEGLQVDNPHPSDDEVEKKEKPEGEEYSRRKTLMPLSSSSWEQQRPVASSTTTAVTSNADDGNDEFPKDQQILEDPTTTKQEEGQAEDEGGITSLLLLETTTPPSLATRAAVGVGGTDGSKPSCIPVTTAEGVTPPPFSFYCSEELLGHAIVSSSSRSAKSKRPHQPPSLDIPSSRAHKQPPLSPQQASNPTSLLSSMIPRPPPQTTSSSNNDFNMSTTSVLRGIPLLQTVPLALHNNRDTPTGDPNLLMSTSSSGVFSPLSSVANVNAHLLSSSCCTPMNESNSHEKCVSQQTTTLLTRSTSSGNFKRGPLFGLGMGLGRPITPSKQQRLEKEKREEGDSTTRSVSKTSNTGGKTNSGSDVEDDEEDEDLYDDNIWEWRGLKRGYGKYSSNMPSANRNKTSRRGKR